MCGMNLALVEGLAGGLGAAGLRPVLDPQPGYCCVAIQDTTAIQKSRGKDDHHGA